MSNRSPSALGSAEAASVIAAACCGDSRPWRAAASVLGCSASFLAASSCWAAPETVWPVLRASMCAGVRSPPMPHSSVSAMRAAARALTVQAMCSMRAARSITTSA